LIREVAHHDLDRIHAVQDWPLRDLLLAYIECMRVAALRAYETELLVWSALAPHQRRKTDPPAIPRVLRS
jgi:hypothetical protein